VLRQGGLYGEEHLLRLYHNIIIITSEHESLFCASGRTVALAHGLFI